MRAYRSRPPFADDGPTPETPGTASRAGSSSRAAGRLPRAAGRPSAIAAVATPTFPSAGAPALATPPVPCAGVPQITDPSGDGHHPNRIGGVTP